MRRRAGAAPRSPGARRLPPRSPPGLRRRRQRRPQRGIVGPAHYRPHRTSLATDRLDQRPPVLQRPPLGGVRGAGRHRDHGPLWSPVPPPPATPPPARCASAPRKNSGGCAIGRHVEVARRGEVALGHRPAIAVAVSLGVDQQRAGQPVLGVGASSGRAPAAGARGCAGCRAGRADGCSDRLGAPRPSSGAIRPGVQPMTRSTCGLWLSSGT